MSEYTKEQEAEALERAAQYSDMDSRPYWRIVLAMAKRTAEAEEAFSRLVADRDYVREGLIAERDALKARVTEAEAKAAQSPFGPSVDPIEAARGIAEIQRAMSPSPPVVVTREVVEALCEFAEAWAHWETPRNGGDGPMNGAAELVVAIRKMLEVKP